MRKRRIPDTLPATLFDRSWPAVPDSMAVHSVLSLSGRLEEDRLARAVRLSLDAEPILGCRFVERWFHPYWRRREDLDVVGVCEVRSSSDCHAEMEEFFKAEPDLPLRVLVLRGDSDMLCVKLDHHVGDGAAIKEYVYLLAGIYNRLEEEPEYRPTPNLDGRSLVQVGRQFGLRDRWRILCHAVKVHRDLKTLAQWEYPLPREESPEYDYATWRLEADRVNAIFEYGCRRRATLSQVLLAAFYIAMSEEVTLSSDLALPASMAIDLRRFLPPTATPAVSNLVGVSVVGIEPGPGASLDAVVQQIQSQMSSQQRYLGLAVSFFPLEALPVIRHLMALRPYGLSMRSSKKPRGDSQSQDHVKGWMILTHVGELDEERLVFRGTQITDAFTTGGVFSFPGLLGLGVSGFRGSLTLHLGCGPTDLVSRLAERIMEILPARSQDASQA